MVLMLKWFVRQIFGVIKIFDYVNIKVFKPIDLDT